MTLEKLQLTLHATQESLR